MDATIANPNRLAGGMFGLELGCLELPNRETPVFLKESALLTCMARSALVLLQRKLAPVRVWLPSYLCEVMLLAFPRELTETCFYPVDEQLNISEEGWMDEVQKGDVVVFIDYFGFNRWDGFADKLRSKGAWIVEDACQALLSKFSPNAHYVICSPRKFVGVPDGGILIAQEGAAMPDMELPPPPAEWWVDALNASVRRREFDLATDSKDKSWFALYQKVESTAPLESGRMSELSDLILHTGVDWLSVATRRRENYSWLLERFAEIAIYSELPENVVPLGFPIRVANRDEVRQRLFDVSIFPAIHWPVSDQIPAEFEATRRLAGEILTIPCDQRMDDAQLERMAKIMKSYIRPL